jgi:hypothetical protein
MVKKLALVLCLTFLLGAGMPAVALAAARPESPPVLAQQGQEEGGGTETGPPWTYQMARITLVLLVLLAVAIGLLYYRLVVRRRRGGA